MGGFILCVYTPFLHFWFDETVALGGPRCLGTSTELEGRKGAPKPVRMVCLLAAFHQWQGCLHAMEGQERSVSKESKIARRVRKAVTISKRGTPENAVAAAITIQEPNDVWYTAGYS